MAAEPAGTNPTPRRSPLPGAPRRVRIGEALIATGELKEEQLAEALSLQKRTGRRLGEILSEQGMVSAPALITALAAAHGVQGVRIRHGLFDPALLDLIGPAEAESLKALPLFRLGGTLTVAMTEPQSLPTIDRISDITGLAVRPVFALEANILEFIKKSAAGQSNIDEFLTSLTESDVEVIEREAVDDAGPNDLDNLVDGSPIVNLVNVAILTAIREGSSDIHIEPSQRGTRVRARMDGVLRDLMRPPPGMHTAIVSRVKVIGKMDIAQKRLPQEGRVRIVAEGREIDLRVSSMPTLLGEKIVIRILDKDRLSVRLEQLGFADRALTDLTKSIEEPHGLVLVTGPTGSGKTTTLYSAIDLLRGPGVNIVTVEDPVEYQLDLINQVQVSDQVGLSFARALRSILRQDPDVIMIGEIRDVETARVAVQAALTGHMVLATLHTNDAASTVARLRDMDIEPYLISSALTCVVAQRLARTICKSCETSYYPSEDVLKDADLTAHVGRAFRRGEGCRRCHDSGFQGRLGIYEVMAVNQEIKRLIYHDAATMEIREAFRRAGGKTLREEGVGHALAGKTSLEEILFVTQRDDVEDEPMPPKLPGPSGMPDPSPHGEAA